MQVVQKKKKKNKSQITVGDNLAESRFYDYGPTAEFEFATVRWKKYVKGLWAALALMAAAAEIEEEEAKREISNWHLF